MTHAHLEQALGTPEQCIEYCSKEDTRTGGPYAFGHRVASQQGKRNDIVALRDAIKAGKRSTEIFDDDCLVVPAVKYIRGMEKMIASYEKAPDRTDIKVTLHYGPAGTGKTRCCHSEDAYYFDGNNGFWNGYNNQRKVIFDEFGGHVLTPLMLQRVCDRYPFSVNIKGSSAPFFGVDIHICSNYVPIKWWNEKTKFNEDAIYRRITTVHWHFANGLMAPYESDTPGALEGCAYNKFSLARLRREQYNEDPVNIVELY